MWRRNAQVCLYDVVVHGASLQNLVTSFYDPLMMDSGGRHTAIASSPSECEFGNHKELSLYCHFIGKDIPLDGNAVNLLRNVDLRKATTWRIITSVIELDIDEEWLTHYQLHEHVRIYWEIHLSVNMNFRTSPIKTPHSHTQNSRVTHLCMSHRNWDDEQNHHHHHHAENRHKPNMILTKTHGVYNYYSPSDHKLPNITAITTRKLVL